MTLAPAPQARPPYRWLKALTVIMLAIALAVGAIAFTYVESRLIDVAVRSLALAAGVTATNNFLWTSLSVEF